MTKASVPQSPAGAIGTVSTFLNVGYSIESSSDNSQPSDGIPESPDVFDIHPFAIPTISSQNIDAYDNPTIEDTSAMGHPSSDRTDGMTSSNDELMLSVTSGTKGDLKEPGALESNIQVDDSHGLPGSFNPRNPSLQLDSNDR